MLVILRKYFFRVLADFQKYACGKTLKPSILFDKITETTTATFQKMIKIISIFIK